MRRESEISRMSHALRGGLQSALLNLQCLAVHHQADAASQQLLDVIRQELLHESRLLVAAFDVLSLDIAGVAKINLGSLVRRTLGVPDLRRAVVADVAWPDVVGDTRLLSLAIGHLARNACEATPARQRPPEIAPAVRRDGRIEIVVRDWGPGFGAVTAPGRAFSSTRPNHLATGLLTVERVARLHGGRLSFKSSDRGTEARLSLPAHPHRAKSPLRGFADRRNLRC